MKAKSRHHPCLSTRERAIQRAKVAQPHIDGLTLVGRQVRAR